MIENIKILQGKTILITGATGLIGCNIIKYLIDLNKILNEPINIIGMVRNIEKANKLYKSNSNLKFIVGNIIDKVLINEPIDYIIHAASQTSSKAFINEPVETINTSLIGTTNMLELAKEKLIKSMVYLSTMEVYGYPNTDEKILETNSINNLNTMAVRSSYPESKRMCESLCAAYCKEYGIPVKVLRLTQTFGPGISYNDERVFAEFARCVIENKDIILHTKGETKRSYLYTLDAVTAILEVLVKGENGQAYNAANEETYCSIYEMAHMVADKCANGKIQVKVEIEDENKFGFAPTLKMNLDTSKLQRLGWKPNVGVEDMFHKLIEDMRRKKYETSVII